jgi:hypothetical protein
MINIFTITASHQKPVPAPRYNGSMWRRLGTCYPIGSRAVSCCVVSAAPDQLGTKGLPRTRSLSLSPSPPPSFLSAGTSEIYFLVIISYRHIFANRHPTTANSQISTRIIIIIVQIVHPLHYKHVDYILIRHTHLPSSFPPFLAIAQKPP